jgi:hypothetical protein
VKTRKQHVSGTSGGWAVSKANVHPFGASWPFSGELFGETVMGRHLVLMDVTPSTAMKAVSSALELVQKKSPMANVQPLVSFEGFCGASIGGGGVMNTSKSGAGPGCGSGSAPSQGSPGSLGTPLGQHLRHSSL